jgi:hypothetical protein
MSACERSQVKILTSRSFTGVVPTIKPLVQLLSPSKLARDSPVHNS